MLGADGNYFFVFFLVYELHFKQHLEHIEAKCKGCIIYRYRFIHIIVSYIFGSYDASPLCWAASFMTSGVSILLSFYFYSCIHVKSP